MARGITNRQKEVLEFIIAGIRENGYPPTILELCAAMGISSTNGVNDHLQALERKGYIERSSKARGIHVTEKAAIDLYSGQPGTLPLVGQVAAGLPLLAEQNIEEMTAVPAPMARQGNFCLRVRGDSMIEAGILDGDLLIVDPSRRPVKGDVVVALVEDETTVKHFYPEGAEIELRPANSAMAPMRYPARSVVVQGVVAGLQRSL